MSDISDFELESVITLAEAAVDTYCQTVHEYKAQHQMSPWPGFGRRIYLNSTPAPVVSIEQALYQYGMIQGSGNPLSITIDPSTILVDDTNDFVLVTTFTTSSGVVAGPSYVNPRNSFVILDYHTGWFLPQLGESLYYNGTGAQYQSRRSFWIAIQPTLSPNVRILPTLPLPPVIYVNGVSQPSGNYTIDYMNGIVEFVSGSEPVPSAKITADYTYAIPDAVREATRLTCVPILAERSAYAAGLVGVRQLASAGIEATARDEIDLSPRAKLLLQNFVSRGI